ncbi:DMT family transporter [Shimazuella kribbensis]|uniref:DMT family transporter n=1 Tax=Shimazuella kribbensis TaxID=139808 RepID=UPI0003F4C625|nr:DMT family transporter [Shimazuella kribbensis]
MKNSTFATIILIITNILWGSSQVVTKILIESVPPNVASFLRYGIAAVFLFLFVMITKRRKQLILNKTQFLYLSALGLIGITFHSLFTNWGLYFSHASDSSIIIYSMIPFITIMLAYFFLKESLTNKQLVGLVLAFIGTITFFSVIGFDNHFSYGRLFGDFLFLSTAICGALYTLLSRNVLQKIDPLVVATYTTLIGSFFLFLCSLPDINKVEFHELSLHFWFYLLYLSIIVTTLANWFYLIGIQAIGAGRTSIFSYISPVSGVILSAWLLQDILTKIQFAASIIIVFGVWLVNYFASDKEKA